MLRKLGYFVLAFGLTLPVWAADNSGSISGYVRSSAGVPQMGAMVEVMSSALHTFRIFTDENGFYSARNVVPGTYTVKASVPAFLPNSREHVALRAGNSVIVNMTMSTLFDAMNIAPMRGPADEEDWKWVLRSAANRPILRAFGSNVKAEKDSESDLKGTLSFLAGSPSDGYGSSSDVSTGFSLEKSVFSTGVVGLQGNLGYGSGSPATVLRASYGHKNLNGAGPEVAFTMRRLASPDVSLRNADLQALALSTSDSITLGDILELKFGSELQTVQFMGRVTALRPFATADLHLSPDTILEYRYASDQPDSRIDRGFDSAPADFSESGPHVTLAGSRASIERAHHHEVSVSHKTGKNTLQLAVYSDHVVDPSLTGVGEVSMENGNVLPDLYSGTFSYQGRDLDTHGVRILAQRKLSSSMTASVDYEYGGVLDLDNEQATLQDARDWMAIRNRHSISGKLSGKSSRYKTQWIASYRWTDGQALTPVDMFNASPGQSEPFLNFFLRQPIPGTGFLSGHMDALVDVRNLLAQGYVPVLGQDGRTVYLVQSARAVRGGLAFTF
jgi:Carboxypeptidase regulatory-like domain